MSPPFRVWERRSKWLRSGGSLRGVLGTGGCRSPSRHSPSVISPSHHPRFQTTFFQETGQTAAQGPSPCRRHGDEAGQVRQPLLRSHPTYLQRLVCVVGLGGCVQEGTPGVQRLAWQLEAGEAGLRGALAQDSSGSSGILGIPLTTPTRSQISHIACIRPASAWTAGQECGAPATLFFHRLSPCHRRALASGGGSLEDVHGKRLSPRSQTG